MDEGPFIFVIMLFVAAWVCWIAWQGGYKCGQVDALTGKCIKYSQITNGWGEVTFQKEEKK